MKREEREGRPAERSAETTSASEALHGSPAPPPQTDHHENYLFYILKEYLKDDGPQSGEHPIESREDSVVDIPSHSTEAAQATVRKDAPPAEKPLIWIDRKVWYLQKIRRRIKLAGWLLFGLSLGLADSVMQWSFGGAFNCYQFPYYSFIGCLDVSHSWEVVFILLIVAAGMIGV